MSGRVLAIWRKRAYRGPMDRVDAAELVAGRGLRGSADQGGKRQITIISEEAWQRAIAQLGVAVDPSARRANVLVRGIDFEKTRGRMLRIGACSIRVNGEVTPCERMNEAQEGLRAALRPEWRGGVFGEIVDGGTIREGDEAEWITEA